MKEYELIQDLGILTVPRGFVSNQCIDSFRETACGLFTREPSRFLTDSHFSNPSLVLESGMKLGLKVYCQTSEGITLPDDRISFLRSLPGNVFAGIRGSILLLMDGEIKERLPRGKTIFSYESRDHSPMQGAGRHLPSFYIEEGGDLSVHMGWFSEPNYQRELFVAFTR